MQFTTQQNAHKAMTSLRSDALVPPGPADPTQEGPWPCSILDVAVQALTMEELRKYNADIACLSEVRIPGNG